MKSNYFTLLNPHHELYRALKENNPLWWQFVKENIKSGEFYVDIRKDNTLNVYYNGGSMLKVDLHRGLIRGKIHQSYLGERGSKYVDYELNRLPKDVDNIKDKIASRFSNTSESGIKARLIGAIDSKYIDSEFAYPEVVGKVKNKYGKEVNIYDTTRIDLTKLEGGKIVFVELKRIEDSRLLTNEYESGKPHILYQMDAYHKFIKAHKSDITAYYKLIFKIKHYLGILPQMLCEIESIDNYELCESVELLIASYDYLNPRRVRRINAIKTILDRNNIFHNL